MKNKNGNGNGNKSSLRIPGLYRGVYSRVARRVGVDPSYVSRVARGERVSTKVEKALLAELQRVEKAVH
jgi:transcriptional regulator with XRE-family HTH domain